ncbi:bifunctional biotin--[acetyl-CoA-carboxylase] ligase/biotin operon repressor BirA [Paraglaciecola sp.]|uniref:bifunctional biotin--[acetyl-CoA-carboxylase] ligase/biotin operon repressor BirA n=1 Tax=Paraglaciecola sp. TaxID=1920173 RepID=UPI00273E3828|nr:bifunctional biotin--[acetyl-CoA-carboxylase] ligase/biotin operon repressor BirA [Paraglaciecola sp.]MDP5030710.1 bifunctional biotin--[acetyl-CoA-carboxylase] ligase/biotin operon repressor BirA [Paraglaciecola sp.]
MTNKNTATDVIRTHIVQQLAKGEFCSGETLGEQLGISRAAVSNHIKCLAELGLDIYSVQGKGYRLANELTLLDKHSILSHINQLENVPLCVLNVIDSTNQFIKEQQAHLPNGFVCLAEAQTAGRGRLGRTWVSPYGASMYLSMQWSFAAGYQAIGGLSLAVGVAIVGALNRIGLQDAQLKWPNDIYVFGKKLAGVLIEVEGQIGGACHCVIGIGVNVSLPESVTQIDQPYIDIKTATNQPIDRNIFAAILIEELTSTLAQFEVAGLSPFIEKWQAVDVYANKPIDLIIGQKITTGIARGINSSGALLVETSSGIRAYQGGEISVRPA